MNYSIIPDSKAVCSHLGLTPSALAEQLGVVRSTISRILKGETIPESLFLQRFYSFAYDNPVRRIDLCPAERKDIKEARKASASTARDKAKLAIEKYRREGRYIEELLK